MANPNSGTRLISGSEVKAWQYCQMKWWYEYRLGVIKKKLSDGLFRGIIGHECLSEYYRALKDGASLEEASLKIQYRIAAENAKNLELMNEGLINPTMMGDRVALITNLGQLLNEYLIEYAKSDYHQYEIVEVEHMHVADNFTALRLDLLVRDLSDGKLVLIDHKFVADFYEEGQVEANTQLPLYMRVVIGDHEEEVKAGILNQIRTRKNGDGPKFHREVIPYNKTVATTLARDQARVAEEIRENYRLPWKKTGEESRDACNRSLSDYTCKFCPNKKPCMAELRGDTALMIHTINTEYERNTYGYNK